MDDKPDNDQLRVINRILGCCYTAQCYDDKMGGVFSTYRVRLPQKLQNLRAVEDKSYIDQLRVINSFF
jgi:hypothetical protein